MKQTTCVRLEYDRVWYMSNLEVTTLNAGWLNLLSSESDDITYKKSEIMLIKGKYVHSQITICQRRPSSQIQI